MTRTYDVATYDDRTIVTTYLDYTRATVHAKCEGLSDADARRAPLPTSPLTTISGLVSHLGWVERSWLRATFLGEPDDGPWTREEPDREMTYQLDLPLAEVLATYEARCQEHRELVAGVDLDTPSVRKNDAGDHMTLKWILVHLIEETARHNGHIDILRELIDGTTGE